MIPLAFHGKPEIKAKYLGRVHAHRAADEIIRGRYWDGKKGCAVGCTLHSSDHRAYETELGIPAVIAHLEDAMFEGMSFERSVDFPEQFLDAVPVGADLSMVAPRFLYWLLTSPEIGIVNVDDEKAREALAEAAEAWRKVIDGEEPLVDQDAARAAAARAAAARAAAAWELMADKLLELLAAAPVPPVALAIA